MKKLNELKQTSRVGWLESGINPNEVEDVAQHTFETVSITLLLGESSRRDIDMEKALKIATIHDWAESITGDFSKDLTEQIGEKMKEDIEENILKSLLSNGEKVDRLKDEYLDFWREYCKGKTIEAKLVKIADKLSILIEANKLSKKKSSKKLKEIRKKTRESLNPYVSDFPILTDILRDLDEDYASISC